MSPSSCPTLKSPKNNVQFLFLLHPEHYRLPQLLDVLLLIVAMHVKVGHRTPNNDGKNCAPGCPFRYQMYFILFKISGEYLLEFFATLPNCYSCRYRYIQAVQATKEWVDLNRADSKVGINRKTNQIGIIIKCEGKSCRIEWIIWKMMQKNKELELVLLAMNIDCDERKKKVE